MDAGVGGHKHEDGWMHDEEHTPECGRHEHHTHLYGLSCLTSSSQTRVPTWKVIGCSHHSW